MGAIARPVGVQLVNPAQDEMNSLKSRFCSICPSGLRWDLVLTWVLAGSPVLVHRFLRSLLDEPIEVMRTATGRDGVSLHSVELADILAFAARLDAKMPALTQAYRTACSQITHTGLGMAWPITPAPTPTT